ncbi:MAG: hypothetical protein OXN88_10585 [Chloroflexota bacterium]|nr:hypothetical protein [Chloroflexota bacterium]
MSTLETTSTMQNRQPVDPPTPNERIARLEERSNHAATVAQLYRVALTIIIGVVGTLGGLIIHLHNQQIALIEKLLAS